MRISNDLVQRNAICGGYRENVSLVGLTSFRIACRVRGSLMPPICVNFQVWRKVSITSDVLSKLNGFGASEKWDQKDVSISSF